MIRTRTVTITAGAVALVVAAGVALTACQSDPEAAPTPTPTMTTASPSPSPSPSTPSPEDDALEEAEAALRDFYRVGDVSLQDPSNFNPDDFKDVAITTALADLENRFVATQQQGFHQIGETKLATVDHTKIDLTSNPDANQIPIVEFRVCYDVSELNVVDADGKSVVSPDRRPTGVVRVGVVNYEYPDGPWLVGFTEYKEGEPC